MGKINSIFTGSALDGPGVRTVVFFQGCPLRCVYCHNPETQSLQGGEEISAAKLFEKIERYKVYYGEKGGVTFSGGEVLLQPDFLRELLILSRQNGIHSAIDTSGFLGKDTPKDIIELCDLVILDIKMNTEEAYSKYTGGSLKAVLEFLDLCEEASVPVCIRQVIVPGINDTEKHIKEFQELIKGKKCIKKVELLPFENMCITKYNDLGIKFPLENVEPMDKDRLKKLQSILREC